MIEVRHSAHKHSIYYSTFQGFVHSNTESTQEDSSEIFRGHLQQSSLININRPIGDFRLATYVFAKIKSGHPASPDDPTW